MESRAESIYAFSAPLLDGRETSLGEFKGKVLLIVNTASKCGFTPQYAGLERLYQTYKDREFAVLGFPSNQFGRQEPGTAEEIGAFCEKNYGVSFPIFAKIDVNGATPIRCTASLESTSAGFSGLGESHGTSPSFSWIAMAASCAASRRPPIQRPLRPQLKNYSKNGECRRAPQYDFKFRMNHRPVQHLRCRFSGSD
jgi:glutathione peroxidase